MKPLTLLVLIFTGFAGVASPEPETVTDTSLSNIYRYYAAAAVSQKNGLFVYDLHDWANCCRWKSPPGQYSKNWGGHLFLTTSSTPTSKGLALSFERNGPSVEILRVKYWWTERPKSVLSTREFVGTILWPALDKCQSTFFDPNSVPENAKLWNLVEETSSGFSYRVQDINLDRILLESMQKRYPNAPPWGIYVESIPVSRGRSDRNQILLARGPVGDSSVKDPK